MGEATVPTLVISSLTRAEGSKRPRCEAEGEGKGEGEGEGEGDDREDKKRWPTVLPRQLQAYRP